MNATQWKFYKITYRQSGVTIRLTCDIGYGDGTLRSGYQADRAIQGQELTLNRMHTDDLYAAIKAGLVEDITYEMGKKNIAFRRDDIDAAIAAPMQTMACAYPRP